MGHAMDPSQDSLVVQRVVGTHAFFQKMTLKVIQAMAKITPTVASTVYTANSGTGMSRNALSGGGPPAAQDGEDKNTSHWCRCALVLRRSL